MSIDDTRPQAQEKPVSEADERRNRQAEALRANLARRKSQARARAETDRPGDDPASG